MYTKFQFFGPTSTIKNSHLAIQINQNQSSISFQLSIKTIIMFCSIWAFFRYKRVIGIILSDHLFDFGPSFKCHIQRMERINWIFRCRTLCQIFWKKKKKKIKKIKYLEARQAVNRELFFIISKRDRKKIFMSLITCELVSATIALFRWSRGFIYFLIYFSFVIDNAKPTWLDCVNSNIYSSILSLLKLHGSCWFTN